MHNSRATSSGVAFVLSFLKSGQFPEKLLGKDGQTDGPKASLASWDKKVRLNIK